ncbi:MAG: photosynthetic reaction center subunit H [Burkholderiales bacterium]|jgi:photosynthetic reaction center H subunit
MGTGAITQYVDAAQVVLYVFWVFFAGVIIYLIRENKREGYPLQSANGTVDGWPPRPEPKTYLLEDGRAVQVPNDTVSPQVLQAESVHPWDGSPIDPVGDPLLAGVGPGSWSDRADVPEHTFEGGIKIVPLRTLPDYAVSVRDRDPRGLPVIGGDGETAGTVVDLWVDQSEAIFRHLEVAVTLSDGATRNVLLPINFCRITRRGVRVASLYAAQFAGVPGTRDPQQVTMLEEEKIMAYYGAGLLYADPKRAEPLF